MCGNFLVFRKNSDHLDSEKGKSSELGFCI